METLASTPSMNPTARNAVAAARFLILPFLGIALAFLPACSKAKQTASRAAEATKDAASRAADATKDAASRAADATLDAAAKTGRAVGETAGNFFSGVGEGVERAIVAYDVDLSAPSLAPHRPFRKPGPARHRKPRRIPPRLLPQPSSRRWYPPRPPHRRRRPRNRPLRTPRQPPRRLRRLPPFPRRRRHPLRPGPIRRLFLPSTNRPGDRKLTSAPDSLT